MHLALQMQAIPEDAVHEDSGDEDGEDPDRNFKEVTDVYSVTFFRFIKSILQTEGFGCPRTTPVCMSTLLLLSLFSQFF